MSINAVYDKSIDGKRLLAEFSLNISSLSDPTIPSQMSIGNSVKSTLSGEDILVLEDRIKQILSRGPRGYPVTGISIEVS